MKTGTAIRKAFNLYLNNPVVILPFLVLGVISALIRVFLTGPMQKHLTAFDYADPQNFLLFQTAGARLLESLIEYAVLLVLFGIFMLMLSSFLEAYAIGLSKKMAKKRVAACDGLTAMLRGPAIIGKNVIIGILFLAGSFVVVVPATILLGPLGALLAVFVLLIYFAILFAVSFFASQCIVVDKLGPWTGIVHSYRFIKKKLESVAVLILFIILLYFTFGIIQSCGVKLGQYFLTEATQIVLERGLHLILFSIILSPFLVVLKTFYYLKNR